jgi:hypothetical protein
MHLSQLYNSTQILVYNIAKKTDVSKYHNNSLLVMYSVLCGIVVPH